jgi:membrane protein implicated in regulation of membrane protease activity
LEVVFWGILAGLAFIGELLSISFFLLFFSLGAVVALGIALAGFGITAQAIGFVGATALSMAVLRPALLNKLAIGTGEEYRDSSGVTGKSGVIMELIEPGGAGTVRIGSGEFWTARSLSPGERIEAGSRVRVLDTDGLTAIVEVVVVEEGG